MPSKKPNKAAKRPAKATSKKTTHKVVSAKKAARPSAKPLPKHATSKATAKPSKPAPKPVAARPPAAKAPRAKSAAPIKPEAVPREVKAAPVKVTPVRFDPRPLVVTPRAPQHDDDGDDSAASASLLAGPRNVKPYIARRGEQYMNKEQLEHFARILQNWKRDLMVEVDRTVLHMKDEAANFPDPNDRATQEEEFSLELRTRDRERKLIRKIDEALKRIEDGSYGYCLETGEEIGIKRLEARPVATLSVEAQERRERREKQYGDRDDRYR
jgi:DnaK suppressor protein